MKQLLGDFLKSMQMLSEEEIEIILDHSVVKAFPKGTELLKEGQIAEQCYLVLKGCVREYLYKDGEERSTAFFTEGEPVNSFTSARQGQPSIYNHVCVEDCILTVGNDDLEKQICALIPRMEAIIRQDVERITGESQDRLASMIISSPEERYLELLEKRPDLLSRVPQHQIASYIGVKPESLSRIRKRMSKAGA